MDLLTALIVKNNHVMPGIYFIFQKKKSQTKFERLSIPNLEHREKIRKVVID